MGYYSHNVLVNVIAGTYLNQAQTQGIRIQHCLNVPPKDISRADEEQLRSGHGYGLAAMRKIAEKYGSMLMIEQLPGEFEIKSNLCLSRGAK